MLPGTCVRHSATRQFLNNLEEAFSLIAIDGRSQMKSLMDELSKSGGVRFLVDAEIVQLEEKSWSILKRGSWWVLRNYTEKDLFFDGVKDMMVFYFNPEKFNGAPREEIKDILVKDYYSLELLSAKKAFFVVGSDIYGPMGHELIPFSSKDAAENFMKDHHGKEILIFDRITPEIIDSMRVGQRMR